MSKTKKMILAAAAAFFCLAGVFAWKKWRVSKGEYRSIFSELADAAGRYSHQNRPQTGSAQTSEPPEFCRHYRRS
jgi:hypothetical protein